jgi:hypothetical protein
MVIMLFNSKMHGTYNIKNLDSVWNLLYEESFRVDIKIRISIPEVMNRVIAAFLSSAHNIENLATMDSDS